MSTPISRASRRTAGDAGAARPSARARRGAALAPARGSAACLPLSGVDAAAPASARTFGRRRCRSAAPRRLVPARAPALRARPAGAAAAAAPPPLPDAGVVHGQDDRADLDLVALLDPDFLDDAGDRRRHLDGGLVGLELEDRLLARDRVADLDQHRATSPPATFSPSSGTLNSVIQSYGGPLRTRLGRQAIAGFGFSGLMPRSLMAFCTTAASIAPSRASSLSVARTMNLASTSKKSRSAARPSLRPKPSVPSEVRRRGSPPIDAVGQHLHVVGRRDDARPRCRPRHCVTYGTRGVSPGCRRFQRSAA